MIFLKISALLATSSFLNHLIDLAVASNAEWIVTQNLKDLNSGELKFNFRAISPNDFMERVDGNNYI